MKDRKTRTEKERAENRKLRKENNELKVVNKALMESLEEIIKNEESKRANRAVMKAVFLYLYEMVVAALILVFVYWIANAGYENFDMPYIFFIALVILVSLKCLLDNKEFRLNKILYVYLNDLLKPFGSMILGLFLCILCLGKDWMSAQNYALDVAVTGGIVLAVAIVVMLIVISSHCLIGVDKFLTKRKKKSKVH